MKVTFDFKETAKELPKTSGKKFCIMKKYVSFINFNMEFNKFNVSKNNLNWNFDLTNDILYWSEIPNELKTLFKIE